MKNTFLSRFSLKNFEEIIQNLWIRFPIPSILVLINAILIAYEIHSSHENSALIMRIIMSIVVTFFLSTSVAIFGEGRKYTRMTHWLCIVLPILYGLGFFFATHALDVQSGVFNEPLTYFSLHLVGFIAGVFFAPYILNRVDSKEEDIEYTNYFTSAAWAFTMSGIVGGVLMALGAIAISAIGALFDSNTFINEWNMYENWAVVSLSLAAPFYGLIHLPKKDSIEKSTYIINTFFSFIIRFVVVPFVILYFCILYAYSIKVLFNVSDWPKGEISWLVIGFSIFGYLGYIFSKPYEEEHTLVKNFRHFFPIAVLPQIPMLGYAIILRINQYDLTMNRYFVVVFGIWLTIISLYFVIGKIKSLTVIPMTLTAITLLISVGPWGVYQLPLERQYNRLIENLETSGILQGTTIKKVEGNLNKDMQNTIYSGIQYVCRFEDCGRIRILFHEILQEAEELDEENWKSYSHNSGEKYTGMASWSIVEVVTKHIGVEWVYDDGTSEEKKYINYYTKTQEVYGSPLDITGFNTLYKIRTYYPGEVLPSGEDYALMNVDTEEFILQKNGEKITFSLKNINDQLLKKYRDGTHIASETTDLSFILEENNMRVKLILESYAVKNPNFSASENIEYPNISGYALIQ